MQPLASIIGKRACTRRHNGKGRSSRFLKSTLEARLARVEALIQVPAEEPSQRPDPAISSVNATGNSDRLGGTNHPRSSPQSDQLPPVSLINQAQPVFTPQEDDDSLSRTTAVPTAAAPISTASIPSPTPWSMPAGAVPSALTRNSRGSGGVDLHMTSAFRQSEGQIRHMQPRIWEHHGEHN